MKTRLLACFAVALVMVASTPAFAGSCPLRMSKIDAALGSSSISADQKAKVVELRARGEAEHKSGQHAASVKTLMEAQAILGIK